MPRRLSPSIASSCCRLTRLSCLVLRLTAKNVQASVQVKRGDLNDRLVLDVAGLKPHLAFDIFTVQRSSLGADGKPDPAFQGSFGLGGGTSPICRPMSTVMQGR